MDSQSSVRVRFTTDFDEYKVITTPLAVPCKLGRLGLSEVINHLLQSDSPIDFDFIINGSLLRSSLLQYLELQKLSNEDILSIQYMPAIHLPPDSQSVELPSWIGSLNSNMEGSILAGCYDGQIQIFDPDTLSIRANIQAHQQSIRSIAACAYGNHSLVFSGSKDHSIQSFLLSDDIAGNLSYLHLATLSGHGSSVESLDICTLNQKNILVSGDWSGNICGWDVSTLSEGTVQESSKARKKKKLDSEVAQPKVEAKPIFSIKAHSQSVSYLNADHQHGRLFSSSWDHSLKEWDVERQDCSFTFVGSKVITSLHYSPGLDSVLTSHTDGRARLWDMREREGGMSKLSFGSESKHWVAQVLAASSLCTNNNVIPPGAMASFVFFSFCDGGLRWSPQCLGRTLSISSQH